MPLNAGETGYGTVSGAGLSGGVGTSETEPLLIPEPESDPKQDWQPLTREQLEAAAGGPGWRKVRCYLVVLFWLAWLAMLGVSIAIVVVSPKPVPTSLRWWQKSLFYELHPDLSTEPQTGASVSFKSLHRRLPLLKSMGFGAIILEGVFHKKTSLLNLTFTAENMKKLAQIQHVLIESSKAELKMVLNLCEVDPLAVQDVAGSLSNHLASVQHAALRFWLEQGAAGFLICDTDAAYSEETLLEWREVLEEFSAVGEERILVVKQMGEDLVPLNISSQSNATLVNVVMRSILPHSSHPLSAEEVAVAIESVLQTQNEGMWTCWTVGGQATPEMERILLVLMMTLPGSPAIQYYEEMDQPQTEPPLQEEINEPSNNREKAKSSTLALFTTLSNSKAREEALLFGSFTFLPSNTTYNVSSPTNTTVSSPSPHPVLAFLRSWGCVHFLVLFNFGTGPHSLDPAWAPSLTETGVFVASSRMNHLGSTSLYTITLQPQEAMVIKLFKASE